MLLCKGHDAIACNQKVVEQADVTDVEGGVQGDGQAVIGATRQGVATRMVMGDDHGRGIVREGGLDDLPRGHLRTPQATPEHPLNINQLTAQIEIQHQKDLVLKTGTVQLQPFTELLRCVERALAAQLGLQAAQ